MKLSTSISRLARQLSTPALLLTLIPGSASFAAVAPGDLIITEVMANPSMVSDAQGEWFEIYNLSGEVLDLNGLTIKDNGSNEHVISGANSLAIGSYYVLGRDGDSTLNGGYSADYEYSNFTLGNSSDAIIIEFDGVVIDSLTYASGDSFGVAGISAELTSLGFSATPAVLTYGDGDVGTPGGPGSDPDLLLAAAPEVPLPSAGWLMATGLATLFSRLRRKPVGHR